MVQAAWVHWKTEHASDSECFSHAWWVRQGVPGIIWKGDYYPSAYDVEMSVAFRQKNNNI